MRQNYSVSAVVALVVEKHIPCRDTAGATSPNSSLIEKRQYTNKSTMIIGRHLSLHMFLKRLLVWCKQLIHPMLP